MVAICGVIIINFRASLKIVFSHDKSHPSAASNDQLIKQLKVDFEQATRGIVLAGFLPEHCVSASAIDLRGALPGGLR